MMLALATGRALMAERRFNVEINSLEGLLPVKWRIKVEISAEGITADHHVAGWIAECVAKLKRLLEQTEEASQ
jgi:hypothetical protein